MNQVAQLEEKQMQVMYSLQRYWSNCSAVIKSPRDIVEKDVSPNLRSLSVRNEGQWKPITYSFIAQELGRLLSWIAVKNTSFDESPQGISNIKELIDLIIQEYPTYKMSDIFLVFRNAKTGYYGQFYNRIDGLVVMSWFAEYDKERTRLWHEAREREEQKYKSTAAVGEVDKEGLLKLAKAYEKLANASKLSSASAKSLTNIVARDLDTWAEYNGLDPDQVRADFNKDFELYWNNNPELHIHDRESIYNWKEQVLLNDLQKQKK